jgi:hypothetical protein
MLLMGQNTRIKSGLIGPPEAQTVYILILDQQVKQ